MPTLIRRTILPILALLALGACRGRAQGPAPVPREYADLYRMMAGKIAAFDAKVGPVPAGRGADVAWGAELLTANCNRGRVLLDPRTLAGVKVELGRLQALGVRAVTVCIGFPLLYRPYFDFNGDPQDYDRFLAFYRQLAEDVHGRGLKLIVETAVLFPGVYSEGSGLKLAEYYRTLDARALAYGRAVVAQAIVQEVKPDFLNLGSEPDTEARLTGRIAFAGPQGAADLVSYLVKQVRAAGAGGTKVGAGVGSWLPRAEAYVGALCGTDVDYIDLHAYPVNDEMLHRLIPLADQAERCGKPVAMSEAWAQKERDEELTRIDATSDQQLYARDAFSFWGPIDRAFLEALVRFAAQRRMLYFSPFWSKFFWAYLDYGTQGSLGVAETVQAGNRAAAAAMVRGDVSPTGRAYQAAIRQASGVSPR